MSPQEPSLSRLDDESPRVSRQQADLLATRSGFHQFLDRIIDAGGVITEVSLISGYSVILSAFTAPFSTRARTSICLLHQANVTTL